MSLKIYNTLTRQKEEFIPLNPQHVGLYVCGPTVYNYVHLGNVRTFMTFDVLYRYLMHTGYKVRYVRNITDVGHLVGDGDEGEDKIGRMAKLEKLEPMEIVQRYTNNFHQVLEQFNLLPPSIEPTATGHIVEQIEMIKQIIADGYVDSRNIGNINTTKSVFIPRNQETLIDLESRVPAVGLSQSLLTIFKDFLYKGKPVMIKIAGYSDFGTIKVPFEQIIPLQKQTNAQ